MSLPLSFLRRASNTARAPGAGDADDARTPLVKRAHDAEALSAVGAMSSRVQRLSQAMAWLCLALVVALPPTALLYWLNAPDARLATLGNLAADNLLGPLADWQRRTAIAIALVPLVLMLAGVWQARQCFAGFARGQIFTAAAVLRLSRFAGWIAASAVAQMACVSINSVVLTLGNPAGQRHLVAAISSNELFLLFFAGMIWLMASIIRQGQTLADENAQFV